MRLIIFMFLLLFVVSVNAFSCQYGELMGQEYFKSTVEKSAQVIINHETLCQYLPQATLSPLSQSRFYSLRGQVRDFKNNQNIASWDSRRSCFYGITENKCMSFGSSTPSNCQNDQRQVYFLTEEEKDFFQLRGQRFSFCENMDKLLLDYQSLMDISPSLYTDIVQEEIVEGLVSLITHANDQILSLSSTIPMIVRYYSEISSNLMNQQEIETLSNSLVHTESAIAQYTTVLSALQNYVESNNMWNLSIADQEFVANALHSSSFDKLLDSLVSRYEILLGQLSADITQQEIEVLLQIYTVEYSFLSNIEYILHSNNQELNECPLERYNGKITALSDLLQVQGETSARSASFLCLSQRLRSINDLSCTSNNNPNILLNVFDCQTILNKLDNTKINFQFDSGTSLLSFPPLEDPYKWSRIESQIDARQGLFSFTTSPFISNGTNVAFEIVTENITGVSPMDHVSTKSRIIPHNLNVRSDVGKRFDCPAGYYGENCTIAPVGSFSPGDGLRHLCYNAPTSGAVYTDTGVTTADCPFECINSSYIRQGNSCVLLPPGMYMAANGTVLPCEVPINAHIAKFTGPGVTGEPFSCPLEFYFPSLIQMNTTEEQYFFVRSLVEATGSRVGFSFEIWLQWPEANRNSLYYTPTTEGVEFTILQIDSLCSFSLLAVLEGGVAKYHLLFRLFSIDNHPPAKSEEITLDGQWHHVAWSLDHQQRSALFYLDGILIGKDWFDMNAIRISDMNDNNPFLALGGSDIMRNLPNTFSPSHSLWMDSLRLNDLNLYGNYSLLPQELAYFVPSNTDRIYCAGYYETILNGQCVNKNYENECSEEEEFNFEIMSCEKKCPRSFVSRNRQGRCLCGPGYYEVWSDSGVGILTLSSSWTGNSPRTLAEIEFYDSLGNLIQISSCIESGAASSTCSRLFDGEIDTVPFVSESKSQFSISFTLLEPSQAIEIERIIVTNALQSQAEWELPASVLPLEVISLDWKYPNNSTRTLLKDENILHGDAMGRTIFLDRAASPFDPNMGERYSGKCIPCPTGSIYSHGSRTRQDQCVCSSSEETMYHGECRIFPQGTLFTPEYSLLSGTHGNGTMLTISSQGSTIDDCSNCQLSITIRNVEMHQTTEYTYNTLQVNLTLLHSIAIDSRTVREEYAPSESAHAEYTIESIAETPVISPHNRGSIQNPLKHPVNVFIYSSTPNCSIYFNLKDIPVTIENSELLPDNTSFVLDGEQSGTGQETLRAKAFCRGNYLPSEESRIVFYFSLVFSSDYEFLGYGEISNSTGSFFVSKSEVTNYCRENLVFCVAIPISTLLVLLIIGIWAVACFVTQKKTTNNHQPIDIEMDTFSDELIPHESENEDWFEDYINEESHTPIFPNRPLPPAPASQLPRPSHNLYIPNQEMATN